MKMKEHTRWSPGLALLALALTAAAFPAFSQGSRLVEGQVLDPDGNTVNGAIVVLINRDTKTETSVVTKEEGRYRFGGLDATVSYRVYAKKDGMKSRQRGISRFAARDRFVLDLRLKPKKDEEAKSDKKTGDGSL